MSHPPSLLSSERQGVKQMTPIVWLWPECRLSTTYTPKAQLQNPTLILFSVSQSYCPLMAHSSLYHSVGDHGAPQKQPKVTLAQTMTELPNPKTLDRRKGIPRVPSTTSAQVPCTTTSAWVWWIRVALSIGWRHHHSPSSWVCKHSLSFLSSRTELEATFPKRLSTSYELSRGTT